MLVIVVEALIRIGKRALKTSLLLALAGLAFVGIFFFALPFPLIVAAAALIGFLVARKHRRRCLGFRMKRPSFRRPAAESLAAGRHRERGRPGAVVGAGRC